MKLAHILVCHTTDPTKAVESIPHQEGAVWYVFLHSENADIERKVEALMATRDGNVFAYRENRGLARSWNEGLHHAMEASCDAVLLLNDDLFFYEDGYNNFIHTIAALKRISQNVSYVTPLGLETGTSAHAGQILAQQFACCAIMPECIERVGYFDETFTPAYYEDIDYDRRTRLAGMTVHVHQAVIAEHERSKTHRLMSAEEQKSVEVSFSLNRLYFTRKWGGDNPFYQSPFNDPTLGLKIAYADRRAPYKQLDAEEHALYSSIDQVS